MTAELFYWYSISENSRLGLVKFRFILIFVFPAVVTYTMNLLLLLSAVLGFSYVSASSPRPLVIWHGLGKQSLSQ